MAEGAVVPEIIRRYRDGESIGDLAKEFKKTRRTIYLWMLSELGDKAYRDLVTECLVGRVADADEKLEDADSVLEITRAREMARFARMDFERRRPALYGPKQEVKHSGMVPSLVIVTSGEVTGGAVHDGTPVPSGQALPPAGIAEKQGDVHEQEGHQRAAVGAG